MNISGVLVRARPEAMDAVACALCRIGGVEIHVAERDVGCLVITVEDDDGHPPEDSLHAIQRLDGVLDAALIYQYSDDSLSEEAQA